LSLKNNRSSKKNRNNGSDRGFTLLEVMVALALVGGLLISLIYTLNYHLGIAERQETETVALMLCKNKLMELDKDKPDEKGAFPEPYSDYGYEVSIGDSSYPGIVEVSVTVTKGDEKVMLKELLKR
jgi:general secretion pathway protein I